MIQPGKFNFCCSQAAATSEGDAEVCFKTMFTHPDPFRLPMLWPAGIIQPGDEAGKTRVENPLPAHSSHKSCFEPPERSSAASAEHRAAPPGLLSHRTVIQASGSQQIWGTQGLLLPTCTWPQCSGKTGIYTRQEGQYYLKSCLQEKNRYKMLESVSNQLCERQNQHSRAQSCSFTALCSEQEFISCLTSHVPTPACVQDLPALLHSSGYGAHQN